MAPAGKVTGFHKEGSDWYVSYNLSNPDFFFFWGGGVEILQFSLLVVFSLSSFVTCFVLKL
jgi:hypothetical protein